MKSMTFSLPFLPPSLNAYRNEHWRKQRSEEKTWKDHIALKWVEMGRPKLNAIRIGMVFTFPDRRTRDLDNFLATGSKLVGDAVKGRFIPDDNPEHLTAWSFRFEFGDEAKTTIVIEEAGRGGAGDKAALWDDPPAQSKKTAAGCPFRGNSCRHCPAEVSPAGRPAEGPSSENRPACALYENCIAPLCPLDRSSLKGVWYPDEEICRSRTQGNLPWLKAQRKLTRVAATGYFNLEMLNHLVVIRKGIAGLDPDVPEEPQLRAWFQKRTEKQDLPPESKAARTRHLKKYSFKKRAGGKGVEGVLKRGRDGAA